MLNSSLRRVARGCPSTVVSSRPVTSSNHGTITAPFSTKTHQRRHSSSKPPIPPNNGAPSIPTASVKQVGTPRSEKRPVASEARLSKRKVTKSDKTDGSRPQEDLSNEWTRGLPSVPSTSHLNPKDVYVASFFSTHRPISITGPFPPETQMEDIDKIFQARPKSSRKKSQEVIYTLSSAVQTLENAADSQQQQSQQASPATHDDAVTQRADLIKALTQSHNVIDPSQSNVTHLDGQPSSPRVPNNVKLVIQEFTRRFRPFNVPPPPSPVPELEFYAPQNESKAKTSQGSISGSAKDDTRATGNFFTSHPTSTPDVLEPVPSRTFGRSHRGVYQRRSYRLSATDLKRDLRANRMGIMHALSVKRQRKLKMKKHKWKKLRRATRNLRRRQGKI